MPEKRLNDPCVIGLVRKMTAAAVLRNAHR